MVPVLNGVKHDAKREKAGLESIIPTKSGCDARRKRRVWRIDKWKMRDEQWEMYLSALTLHSPLDLHVDTVSFKENLKNSGSGTPDPVVIIGDEIGLESL